MCQGRWPPRKEKSHEPEFDLFAAFLVVTAAVKSVKPPMIDLLQPTLDKRKQSQRRQAKSRWATWKAVLTAKRAGNVAKPRVCYSIPSSPVVPSSSIEARRIAANIAKLPGYRHEIGVVPPSNGFLSRNRVSLIHQTPQLNDRDGWDRNLTLNWR